MLQVPLGPWAHLGPGPIWAQAPLGLGPTWARVAWAQAYLGSSPLGPGSLGPGEKALGPLGPGPLGPTRAPGPTWSMGPGDSQMDLDMFVIAGQITASQISSYLDILHDLIHGP